MKQSFDRQIMVRKLFPGSDIVRMYAFRTMLAEDRYALLARANHRLAMNIAISRGESAHLRKKDCFECLSPHELAV